MKVTDVLGIVVATSEVVANKGYQAFPTYRVKLPGGGEATLAWLSDTKVHFDANHHCINGQPGDRCWLVYRGREFGVSAHYQLTVGKDAAGADFPQWTCTGELYGSPIRSSYPRRDTLSSTAAAWITELGAVVVREFARQHPEVVAAAGRQAAEQERAKLMRRVAELKAEVAAAEQEIARIGRQLGLCKVCGVAGPEHGYWSVTDPRTHKIETY